MILKRSGRRPLRSGGALGPLGYRAAAGGRSPELPALGDCARSLQHSSNPGMLTHHVWRWVACQQWALDRRCLSSVPSPKSWRMVCCWVLWESGVWGGFSILLYCPSKNITSPFLGSKPQCCGLALYGSSYGECKCQGSAKSSFYLVAFYWWFSF